MLFIVRIFLHIFYHITGPLLLPFLVAVAVIGLFMYLESNKRPNHITQTSINPINVEDFLANRDNDYVDVSKEIESHENSEKQDLDSDQFSSYEKDFFLNAQSTDASDDDAFQTNKNLYPNLLPDVVKSSCLRHDEKDYSAVSGISATEDIDSESLDLPSNSDNDSASESSGYSGQDYIINESDSDECNFEEESSYEIILSNNLSREDDDSDDDISYGDSSDDEESDQIVSYLKVDDEVSHHNSGGFLRSCLKSPDSTYESPKNKVRFSKIKVNVCNGLGFSAGCLPPSEDFFEDPVSEKKFLDLHNIDKLAAAAVVPL